MQNCFTVSQLQCMIEGLLSSTLGFVWVSGEIAQVSVSARGHKYLTMQEDRSVLKAVVWSGSGVSMKLEQGMRVKCLGKVSVYQSVVQLIIERLLFDGNGELERVLLERKERLQKEGLFDQIHKNPIPRIPDRVGVITSLHGSVLQDIIACAKSRMGCRIVVWPVSVQGEGALNQICDAISGFNAMKDPPEVLIIARGGGSAEDMWVFNEELLVRSVFASVIPIISAIGHETDFTLIDYVSDYRSPTPSLAAELVFPKVCDLSDRIRIANESLKIGMQNIISNLESRISGAFLPSPIFKICVLEEHIEFLASGLYSMCKSKIDFFDKTLEVEEKLLEQLGNRYFLFRAEEKSEKVISMREEIAEGEEVYALCPSIKHKVRLKVEGLYPE